MKEYDKIGNVFKFDPKYKSIVGLNEPYEILKNLVWQGTEKIDGCLINTTRVIDTEGKTKLIKEVKIGDVIMGYDTTTKTAVPTKVLNVSHKYRGGEWYEIKTNRYGVGRGNCYGIIRCTGNHEIFTSNRGFVRADQLTLEDRILSIRTELGLSPIQDQVLTGKMLGDGNFAQVDNGTKTAAVTFSQKEKEYVQWCLDFLQDLARPNIQEAISGYGTHMYRASSISTAPIYNKFISWFDKGHKEVPENISLTPISMAFWYMDDGALEHAEGQEDRVVFATNAFDLESCNILIREFKKFDIEAKIKQNKGNTIALNASEAEKLFLLIYPYISNSKKYKLPERYRHFVSNVPKVCDKTFHKMCKEQNIISIKPLEKRYERWDLTTDVHNFFTTGGLVHNCNTRIYWDGHDVSIFGHTDRAEFNPAVLAYLESVFKTKEMEYLFEQAFQEKEVLLFGETYGDKIQGGGSYLPNGKGTDFILFDVSIGDFDLKRDSVNDIASQLGLSSVPVVFEGTLDEAKAFVASHPTSTLGPGTHEMEGLVLTPRDLQLYDNRHHLIRCKCKYRDMLKAGLADA